MKINFKLTIKIFFLIIVLLILATIAFYSYVFAQLSRKINYQPLDLINTVLTAYQNNPFQNRQYLNFLVLGLDKRDDWLEKTEVTDTIMLASLNLNNGKFNVISLPRDLWDYKLQTKINQIYPMSLKEENSFDYIKTNFQRVTGQYIDHVIIFDTKNLIEFVQAINGVDVYLENGFKDDKYPNPDYINNPGPNVPVYKTIEFSSGLVHLNQSNITEFVRSRKGSDDPKEGGTDIGRIKRQQLLIEAIIDKIKTKESIQNISQAIQLFNFWKTQIKSTINDSQLFSIAFVVRPHISNLSLNKIDVPIGTNPETGVIYHPAKFINKQWVFIPSDQQYQKIHQFLNQSLK